MPRRKSSRRTRVRRNKDGTLNYITLTIPNYDITSPTSQMFGLAPSQTMPSPTEKTVRLKPGDFVIEDDPNYSGVGYKADKHGQVSYNIFNNLYELRQ